MLAQYLVTDTIFIDFKADTIVPVNFNFRKVVDNRYVNPKFVSYTTRKKLLLIPVDEEICLKSPLSEVINASVQPTIHSTDTFTVQIEEFVIEKFKGRFTSYYQLKADFTLDYSDSIHSVLSYSYPFNPKKKKTSFVDVCEEVIEEWHTEFKIDMNQVATYYRNERAVEAPTSLIENELKRTFFFSTTAGGVVGLDFWQLEGEMYFTRPETKDRQATQGGIIRYQNTKEFEMIGFGKRSEHMHKRISDKLLFDLSTNLLLGINKWRVPDQVELPQIVQLSFSSNQSINIDRKNEQGLLLKAGLFENVYYIYKKPLKFQIGLYLSLGYKF